MSYITRNSYKVDILDSKTDDNDINQYTQVKSELEGNEINTSFEVNYLQTPAEEEKQSDNYLMSIEAQKEGIGYVAIKPEDKEEKEGLEKEMESSQITAESDGRNVNFSVESSNTPDMEKLLNDSKKRPVSSRNDNEIGMAKKRMPWA